jgi:hypothetical protein
MSNVEKTKNIRGRVKSGNEGKTPIPGAVAKPIPKDLPYGRINRPQKAIPRKNEPPQTAQSRMGLHIGGRVTRGKH